jgi:hypothetical protein
MRWREAGGQAILTLRGLIQSDRFDPAWPLLAAEYKREVSLPENVIPISATPRSRRQYESYPESDRLRWQAARADLAGP